METIRDILVIPIVLAGTWLLFLFVGYAFVFKYVFLQAHKEGTNCPSCLYEFMVHAGWRLVLQAGAPICLLIWLCLTRVGVVPATVQKWAYEGIALLVGLTVGAGSTWWIMSRRIEALRKAPPTVLGVPNLDDMTPMSYVDHLQDQEKQKEEEA